MQLFVQTNERGEICRSRWNEQLEVDGVYVVSCHAVLCSAAHIGSD